MNSPQSALQNTEYDDAAKAAGFAFISDLGTELSSGKLELPAFPDVAVRVKNALDNPDVTSEQVAKVVGSDPVFSAKLLKVANSVMVNGSGQKIDNIQMAVTRMGFKLAYNTAVSIAVEQVLNSSTTKTIQPYLEQLWHHSVMVAAYSYVIAKHQTSINPDIAMLAGLLHDIGNFYILTRSEQYPELFASEHVLKDIMHEWHTGIGRNILEAWNFSEEFCLVADEHEVLNRELEGPADLTDVVMVSNLFVRDIPYEVVPAIDWENVHATRRLNLNKDNATKIMQESDEEISSIIQALEN